MSDITILFAIYSTSILLKYPFSSTGSGDVRRANAPFQKNQQQLLMKTQ